MTFKYRPRISNFIALAAALALAVTDAYGGSGGENQSGIGASDGVENVLDRVIISD